MHGSWSHFRNGPLGLAEASSCRACFVVWEREQVTCACLLLHHSHTARQDVPNKPNGKILQFTRRVW